MYNFFADARLTILVSGQMQILSMSGHIAKEILENSPISSIKQFIMKTAKSTLWQGTPFPQLVMHIA